MLFTVQEPYGLAPWVRCPLTKIAAVGHDETVFICEDQVMDGGVTHIVTRHQAPIRSVPHSECAAEISAGGEAAVR